MSASRWQPGTGPGARRLPWKTRAKRWLVEIAMRDARMRRMALNRVFSNHGADGLLCLVPFADHTVFVDPRDDRIAYSLLSGRSWQRTHLEAALGHGDQAGRLQANGIFVDLGANIGLMTIYAMLSGRFASAIAIEPDPWNQAILQRNLDANGLSDRVTVVGKAASSAAGSMALHRDSKNLGAHSLEPGFVMSPENETQQVTVDRLDTILVDADVAAEDVSFIKIDVEGHEFAALEGMPALIAQRPPIMIEVTFGAADNREETSRLKRLLTGYEMVFDIGPPDVTAPIALSDFQATAPQHELLIM